jgi:hypothetical protein
MHFTYTAPNPSPELLQGDVLQRTPALEQLLKDYYPYFGNNPDNQFFLVISQSCDLVPRDGGVCKAKYIELAAIRPVHIAIERELDHLKASGFNLPFSVATMKSRAKFEQFLTRLFNNNEPDYFFLRAELTTPLAEDSCAFLHLTVPIKASHYADCVSARILSLTTVFQAKLGWLVGQIYSRVGTEDWPKTELARLIAHHIGSAGIWVDDRTIKPLAKASQQWQAANPGKELDKAGLEDLLRNVPKKKDVALDRVKSLLAESAVLAKLSPTGTVDANDVEKIVKKISSDPQFASLFA